MNGYYTISTVEKKANVEESTFNRLKSACSPVINTHTDYFEKVPLYFSVQQHIRIYTVQFVIR